MLTSQKGWSKAELARRASVTTTAVWNWEENRRKPRSETISAIAQALGVSELYLEHGFDPPVADATKAFLQPSSGDQTFTVAEIIQLARTHNTLLSGMPENQIKITVEFVPG
jgi:transcriptional regulator with XRE-family HTH domain